ncbi:CoA transferase [Rhizobium sp. PL01]|uniref:CoA transferase n=1 Tax=Rhizobium sp. PL01 TaxID=3085631 RepID=UPI002982AF56|nr:CoA transferase [Rhizobium sp. PL01]MDW5318520.1 CoA transferase [Rhizobium sp. PL01]
MTTSIAPAALPLSGVRVVDFGQYIAGPAVAMILGDLGATVVHIDPPSGPLWDNPANAILNRNKLIVTIDLKTETGLAEAKALAAEADIVVENFRPGVLARLGIDFEALRTTRPELISVSIPGFASNDQLRRDWRAFETVIAASSGVFTDMGLNRVLMGINPSFSPLPLASAYGTMLAASAAVLALQSRQRTGHGDHIEVPLAAAVMEGLSYNSIKIDDYPMRYQTQREQEIERRRAEDLPMDMSYDDLQEFLDPFYRSFQCSDGRMFYVVCPSHKNHAKRCLQALGIYDDLVAEGLREEEDTYLPVSEWSSDVSLGVYPLPKFWADKIASRMKDVFLTKTAAEWERVFGEGLFPGAPQRWLQEWIADDHAKAAGLMIEVEDPVLGRMIQPGPMAWLQESAEAMLSPAPRAWGSVADALARLRTTKTPQRPTPGSDPYLGWLDGIKVLDLCNVIAGPHSAAYLARFGAEVIKIDPAKPLYDCWNTVIFGMSHMRGKQSALLNIGSPDGRLAFEKLVQSVDIIIWNATDRQVNAMGMDVEGLKAINPQAIFCQLDCFGGGRKGPRTNYLGYDDLVQAATGIMLRFGGSMKTPEEHAHVGTIDVMCGFGAALVTAAALYQKSTTGVVGRPRTSLSALTGLAQIPFCYDYAGRQPFNEPAGRETMGFDALSRVYETADGGAILLAASEADLPRFAVIEGLEDLPSMPSLDRAAYLARTFATASAETWQRRLIVADIGASLCENLGSIRSRGARVADGTPGTERGSYAFSIFPDHPSGRTVTQLDPFAVRPRFAKVASPPPAEKYGASTTRVLSELGYRDDEIEKMIASGTASVSWSREYLPS